MMNKTDEKIAKALRQGCDIERIAARLGRPLSQELRERIEKIKKERYG